MMTSKEALERLYQEREFAYANKVNHKGENWHSDIEHYDNIGKCLEIIEKDLEVLEILRKYYYKNDGTIIEFWAMPETQLKKVKGCLEDGQ